MFECNFFLIVRSFKATKHKPLDIFEKHLSILEAVFYVRQLFEKLQERAANVAPTS